MAIERKPPGGRGDRRRPRIDDGSLGQVFDFTTRQRLKPEEIERLGEPDPTLPPDELRAMANSKGAFTMSGYRDRARVLLDVADEVDVLRVLEDSYHFTGASYSGSYLEQGISSVTRAPYDILALNSSFPWLSTGQRWIAVELLIFLRGNNYIEKCLGDNIPENLREQVRWQEMVDEHGLKFPEMQSDTYAALSLVSRQKSEREQRREGLVDEHDRLTANPLLLRPDVLTLLRTLLQERAIQWTMQCEPRDLDDIARQMKAAVIKEPSARALEKRLRALDVQQAKQILQSGEIRKLISTYQQRQQEFHRRHQTNRQRIVQLQKELEELPRSSFLAQWLSPGRARQYQDEVTAQRATRLLEEIDRLQTELDNDIEPKLDPQWQFNNTHPTPRMR